MENLARSRRTAAALGLTLALLACGDEPGGGGDSGGGTSTSSTSSTTSTSSDTSTTTAPPTGDGDGNWRKAFLEDGAGVSCAMSYDEMVASGAPSIASGATTIFVGFQQYDNNQDPVFARFDDGQQVYCEHHEKESPDARAVGITWDGGPRAFVVYTVTGGGTAFDDLAQGGWIDRYGDGGGSSAVAVVAAVETQLGTVERATFVPAKRENGTKTNTLRPADAITVLTDGALEFVGESAFAPLNPDRSGMCTPTTEYPAPLDGAEGPSYLARFAPDLASMSCASTAGCSSVTTPCP